MGFLVLLRHVATFRRHAVPLSCSLRARHAPVTVPGPGSRVWGGARGHLNGLSAAAGDTSSPHLVFHVHDPEDGAEDAPRRSCARPSDRGRLLFRGRLLVLKTVQSAP